MPRRWVVQTEKKLCLYEPQAILVLDTSFAGTLIMQIHLPRLRIFDIAECVTWLSALFSLQKTKTKAVGQFLYNILLKRHDKSKRQRHWNDRFYQKFIIKSLNLYKTFTRRTSNGIMDGFIRKVNQKVNLPGFAILKDRFLKTRPIKRFHICLKM